MRCCDATLCIVLYLFVDRPAGGPARDSLLHLPEAPAAGAAEAPLPAAGTVRSADADAAVQRLSYAQHAVAGTGRGMRFLRCGSVMAYSALWRG